MHRTKKSFTAFGYTASSIIVCIAFLMSFIQINTTDVLIIESLAKEYAPREAISTPMPNGEKPLREYEWPYSIHIVHYLNHTDTVITAPGTPPQTLEGVVSYESCTKLMDNFMLTLPLAKGAYYGDWIVTATNVPSDKKQTIQLRKIQDFKPEQPLVLASGIPVARVGLGRKSSNDYFAMMREVSRQVDVTIADTLTRQYASPITKKLFALRNKKAKLRPLLTYAAYQIKDPDRNHLFESDSHEHNLKLLCALQELQSLELYTHNWIIDGKHQEISRGDLVIANAEFRFAGEELINSLKLPMRSKDVLRGKFITSSRKSYMGQHLEITELTLDAIIAKCADLHEGVYRDGIYSERCMLLNTPYAFSLWSGGNLAGADTITLHLLWNTGIAFGTGLQVLNDLHDILPENQNRFTDLTSERITLPYYLDLKYPGIIDAPDGSKLTFIKGEIRKESFHHYQEAKLYAQQLPEGVGRSTILQALDILVTSKVLS